MKKQKHLNLDARSIIELELTKNNSFNGIALLLNKDCTTISKEIRSHIVFEKQVHTKKLLMIANILSITSAI